MIKLKSIIIENTLINIFKKELTSLIKRWRKAPEDGYEKKHLMDLIKLSLIEIEKEKHKTPEQREYEFDKNEFLKHHYTGFIGSDAYERYEKEGGLSWLGDKSKYPILLDKGKYGNFDVEFRQEDTTTIVAFINDKPVGLASNEFGAVGVWVEGPYQKLGIGTDLLDKHIEQRPTIKSGKEKIGQMTNKGISMTKKYYDLMAKRHGKNWFQKLKQPTVNEAFGDKTPLEKETDEFKNSLIEKYPQLEELFFSIVSCQQDVIHLASIRIKNEFRGKGLGIGTKVIKDIKDFADKHGLIITLSPEADRGCKKKLDRFYRNSGFHHNKGRKKDYRLSSFCRPIMIRRPLTESLVLESKIMAKQFAESTKDAYSTILDIDDVKILRSVELMPTSFMHQYVVYNIYFIYRMRKFFIYHHFYHYKFPPDELKGLSSEEWMNMLASAEKFKKSSVSITDIKGRNPLVSFNASVYEVQKPYATYWEKQDIGRIERAKNIGELVTKVKALIDKYIDGDDEPVEEVPPVPIVPTGIREPSLVEETNVETKIIRRPLTESLELSPEVDILSEKLAKFIASFFLKYFKTRIHNTKTKSDQDIVKYNEYYRLAKQYKDEGRMLFKVSKCEENTNWGKASLLIKSESNLIPDTILRITNGYTISNNGYILDMTPVRNIFILVDTYSFIKSFKKSTLELIDTVKHEIRHAYQYAHNRGFPKKNVLNKKGASPSGWRDIHGRKAREKHHMRDIEFKTNLHTYSFYIKKFLNRNFSKPEWKEKFNNMITGKPMYIGNETLNDILDNLEHMKNKDFPRWKLFVKELYKLIFSND